MHAAAGDIYDVFLNEGRVKAFTMSDATVSKEVDGKFSMFGGSIEGIHRELVPGKKIVQDWRFTTWPDNVYSLVCPLCLHSVVNCQGSKTG
jgi:activator of HSP90 ATPase